MPDRACLHCGQGGFQNRDALWYHVRRCEKNPNPVCEKCGLHFIPARIAEHRRNCGSTRILRAAALGESTAPPAAPSEAPPAEPKEGAALLGVPPDRLTATDELILPLLAPPGEKPAPPPPKREPQDRAPMQEEEAGDDAPPDEDAADDHDAPDATQGGLARTFEARDPPRTAALSGLADSLKRNWVLLTIIAALLVVVILWRRLSGDESGGQASQVQAPVQETAMPPPVRPPYNPDLHGSLEQYRATFGHLPSPGGA